MQCSFSPAYVAGRTDRHVSAVSQVICVSTTRGSHKILYKETPTNFVLFEGTKKDVSREDIVSAFHNSEACREGRLVVLDCQRVPKKFNARSSATWRRYLYLFPLNIASETDTGLYDIDTEHVNRILSRYNILISHLDTNVSFCIFIMKG